MYMFSPYVIQKIDAQLQTLKNQLLLLQERVINLEEQLNDIRKEKQMYIDRIEYKFDQLKVERLEGTLNIGLSPYDRNAIEQYVVGEDGGRSETIENQDLFSRVQQQIYSYMQEDVYDNLKETEKKYQYPLDEPYRKFIIEDIKRQLDKRIAMYVNNLERTDPQNPEKENIIIEKVRNDIHKAIEEFIKHLPKQEG